jgi:signal transduction histidine kinase
MLLSKKEQHKTPLQTVIEDLKDGFCTIEKDGGFIYINRVAVELFELYNDTEKYNFYNDIVRDERHNRNIKKVLQDSEFVKDYEIDLYTITDNTFPVLLTLNYIRDPHDNVVGISILIKDMTYIKKVQQQLLQAQKLESIGMLASGIAHEFNNILTGIIPNAELIKMTMSPESTNYNRAASIQRSAVRASDIVKKLLSFSRDDKINVNEVSNFIVVSNETIDILKKLFQKNIQIKSSYPSDLFQVKIDATRLQQIIMNLSINAKDAISEKGEINVTAQNYVIDEAMDSPGDLTEGKYVLMQISDTGQGIPFNDLGKIFDPFFTTKEPGKGTGLGLSIIYGIIKSVKGKIEVQSEINVGTTFSVYFPATGKKAEEDFSDYSIEIQGGNKTILIIDDEPMIREMSRDMLSTIGYNVLVSENGADGLKLFEEKSNTVDLVLLDLLMPEMNGITCFKKLKEIKDDVKVVISSGVADLTKRNELEEIGVTGYLEKPFSLKTIADYLKKTLN